MNQNKEKLKEVKRIKYKQENKEKANPIETITLEILQSAKNETQLWLSFQDITDEFQNKTLIIDYWNKPTEFRKDLLQALNVLQTNGKIEKKIVGTESYFSNTS
jgi:hypothetical protein